MLVHYRIAEVKSHRERPEFLDRGERVFRHEHWIAGVEIRPDKLSSGSLYHLPCLPGVQIFVVLDADLQPGVHDLGAHFAENLDRGIHVRLDRTIIRHAVPITRDESAHNWRAHGRRPLDMFSQQRDRPGISIRSLRQ